MPAETFISFTEDTNPNLNSWIVGIKSDESEEIKIPFSVLISRLSGYYPSTNPSGFITGVDLSNYYPIDNPSGFITGVDLSSYVTGNVVRQSETGNFYTRDNPSGFITGVDLSSYVKTDQTGNFAGGGSQGAWKLLGKGSGSYVNIISVDNIVTTGYAIYKITAHNLAISGYSIPEFILRSSVPANIGGTYRSSAHYTYPQHTAYGDSQGVAGTNGFRFYPVSQMQNQATSRARFCVEIDLYKNPSSKWISFESMCNDRLVSEYIVCCYGHGINLDTTTVAGFAVAAPNTTISGEICVYGLSV